MTLIPATSNNPRVLGDVADILGRLLLGEAQLDVLASEFGQAELWRVVTSRLASRSAA